MITLEMKKDKYLLTIDKSVVDRKTLQQLIDRFRTEQLAKKVNFNKSILKLGEEIKTNWWKSNKERLLHKK
jgi:hypothetical protein